MKIYEKFNGKIVPVELGDRSYPIYIGGNILDNIGECLKFHLGQKKAAIVTDTNVGKLYANRVQQSLEDAGIKTCIISVEAGEQSKRQEVLDKLYDQMFDFELERSDSVVALGGGVIGDLAGFAAASFKRGTKFVQVPTSLLAMVDSSVGGKTGINHPRGKNMIGAFYQPSFVFADVETLKTLSARELSCGLAESVKHGVIRNAEFFEWMEENAEQIVKCDTKMMTYLVGENVKVKAGVVAQDEKEGGLRQILNYGHTFGHAVEVSFKVEGDNLYHHGEAVAIGIKYANMLASDRDMLTEDDAERIHRLLGRFNLPLIPNTAGHPEVTVDKLDEAMRHDKKVKDGKLVFVLAKGIGDCEIVTIE